MQFFKGMAEGGKNGGEVFGEGFMNSEIDVNRN